MKRLLYWLAKKAGVKTDYFVTSMCPVPNGMRHVTIAITVCPWLTVDDLPKIRAVFESEGLDPVSILVMVHKL